MMNSTHKNQSGGSVLGNILLLGLFAYGVFLGMQYLPQMLESKSLDSMLDSIDSQHRAQAYEGGHQVEQAVKGILNLNQMDDMMEHIQVRSGPQGISIEIDYERELDLLFQKKMLKYRKTLDLDRGF
jgi:hypothetical protein